MKKAISVMLILLVVSLLLLVIAVLPIMIDLKLHPKNYTNQIRQEVPKHMKIDYAGSIHLIGAWTPVCRHEALFISSVIGEKYPVRLAYGQFKVDKEENTGIFHIQTQILLDGLWYYFEVAEVTQSIYTIDKPKDFLVYEYWSPQYYFSRVFKENLLTKDITKTYKYFIFKIDEVLTVTTAYFIIFFVYIITIVIIIFFSRRERNV